MELQKLFQLAADGLPEPFLISIRNIRAYVTAVVSFVLCHLQVTELQIKQGNHCLLWLALFRNPFRLAKFQELSS